MDLVSVIVPVYNEEVYLKPCVESIVRQTYKNLEVILVDDGSTNKAGILCDTIAKLDGRIKVIHQENKGLSSARVSGLLASNGGWVMFADNDDVLLHYAIERLLAGATEEDVEIVAGRRADLDDPEFFDADKQEKTFYITKSGRKVIEAFPLDKQKTIITPMWGKIYRRSIFERVDYMKYKACCPTIYFEDVFLTPILYAEANKITLLSDVVYIHREVLSSISRSAKLSPFYYEQIKSGEILLEYAKSYGLKNYYAYFLGIHIGAILRIWCLIDDVQLESERKEQYKKDIIQSYKKNIKEYYNNSDDSICKKAVFGLFAVNRTIFGVIVRKLYYHK